MGDISKRVADTLQPAKKIYKKKKTFYKLVLGFQCQIKITWSKVI